MELVNLDIAVLVIVNLVEAVHQGQASLQKHLHQVVKDLVLSVHEFTLLLDFTDFLDIVLIVEGFKLLELDNAILIAVNLIEEGSDLVIFDRQVEQLGKRSVEVCQSDVALFLVIEVLEGSLDWQLLSDLLLNGTKHLEPLLLLINLALNLPVGLLDIVGDALQLEFSISRYGDLILLLIGC